MLLYRAIGVGISKTISMSKTRKITARRKNRVENGIRALFLGSNPHSNGVAFSRSLYERDLSKYAIKRRIGGIVIVIIDMSREIIIHKGYSLSLFELKGRGWCIASL